MSKQQYQVGLIGYGYWGPTLLRNFAVSPHFRIHTVCDRHQNKAAQIRSIVPDCRVTADVGSLFADKELDVVVIATQAASHAELTTQALQSGKHIFVEKPFTLNLLDAERVCSVAERMDRKIWIDHTFLFNPAFEIVQQQLAAGKIGKLWRWHSTRTAFGRFQRDANIIWHLVYHDAYLLRALFPYEPHAVTAVGASHVVPGIEDGAIVSLSYAHNVQATLLCDMTFPLKRREIIVTGDKGALVWDEGSANKLIFYRQEALVDPSSEHISYDQPGPGEILSVPEVEALAREIAAFAAYLNGDLGPLCDGQKALETVKLVTRIQSSFPL